MLEPLPASFATTRDGLHILAEHVIAPARYRVDGHIGLVPAPGGFGTPAFGDKERVRVDGPEVVHERPGSTTRMPITTAEAAAEFIGVPLGAPANLYTPATTVVPDAPLGVDGAGARAFASWLEFVAACLRELAPFSPSAAQMWPEHFDYACEAGDEDAGTRANFGASPGDADIAEPYLYVGPWDPSKRVGPLAMYSFGGACPYTELLAADDPAEAARAFYFDSAALIGLSA
jgi:hypothetical protein